MVRDDKGICASHIRGGYHKGPVRVIDSLREDIGVNYRYTFSEVPPVLSLMLTEAIINRLDSALEKFFLGGENA